MKRTVLLPVGALLFVVFGATLLAQTTMAQVLTTPDLSSLKGSPRSTPIATKQLDDTERLRHEIWGQADYGDGYIYGPTNRRSGMTVVDIDLDGDNDFVFPSSISSPQLMRNLGSSSAFYPGGSVTLEMENLPEFTTWDLNMDFADLTGDGLPDLVAVVNYENGSNTFNKQVAYYRNDGPRTNPTFSYQRILASSEQGSGNQRAMWVALGDINGDGLQDLFIAEAWIFETERHHRVYQGLNTGSRTEPVFSEFLEVTELGNVLPARIEFTTKERKALAPFEQRKSSVAKGTDYSYNLGDIAIYDWDFDGVLDFMFYDRSNGLTLVRNTGSTTAATWSSTIGTDSVTYIYDHGAIDDLTYAEATFAIRENPDSALPG
ncbi:MAG: VCBS repeat-containing protein, partial [Candidatus Hydrogenedentes bacterium]|nr:VCBS repeat-containing protein [Candidatus Hydrogenedentota bacterium]